MQYQNNFSSPLWISEGDCTGISYEILNKSISKLKNISEKRPVVLVQSQKQFTANEFQYIDSPDFLNSKGLYFILTDDYSKFNKKKFLLGKPDIDSGLASFYSLRYTLEQIKKYGGDLITLPLSKEWVIKSGIKKFQGHTEYLAEVFKCNTYMIMYSENLKILIATTHIPLKKVVPALKKLDWKKLFHTISESSVFQIPITIGLCGINPHAGEDGKIGNEEQKILIPILKKYSSENLHISGPYPADSIFTEEWKGRFQLVVAMYHDQGLGPFKALAGKEGINLTIGLPFIRVSPDHGPAYSIAESSTASSLSLEKCLDYLGNYA